MNQLQVFGHSQFGEVRTITKNNEPWFIAADVCRVLDISNNRDATSKLDADEKGVVLTDTLGGEQKMTIVNEYGLYSLVLGSRKPEAKTFKRWVTHEVIPAIRKTGGYVTEASKVEASKMRAEAMLKNAQVRALKEIRLSISDAHLSSIAMQVFGLKAIENVAGVDVGNLLPEVGKTYTATDIASEKGVTAQRVGKLANQHGMKTDEYGIFALDKSPYSSKQVTSFRYNQKGYDKLCDLLS